MTQNHKKKPTFGKYIYQLSKLEPSNWLRQSPTSIYGPNKFTTRTKWHEGTQILLVCQDIGAAHDI
eukprot:15112610-Ditylum_brightwellii.AAC.1